MLDDEDLSGGDFVRNVKQLIDLLRQIGEAAPTRRHGPDRGPGGRRVVPRRGRRLVGGRRRRRGESASTATQPIDAIAATGVTIERGAAWGAPGRCRPTACVVRTDAEARAVVERAERAGEPIPPLGLLGGDLCRTLGRHRATRLACGRPRP